MQKQFSISRNCAPCRTRPFTEVSYGYDLRVKPPAGGEAPPTRYYASSTESSSIHWDELSWTGIVLLLLLLGRVPVRHRRSLDRYRNPAWIQLYPPIRVTRLYSKNMSRPGRTEFPPSRFVPRVLFIFIHLSSPSKLNASSRPERKTEEENGYLLWDRIGPKSSLIEDQMENFRAPLWTGRKKS